MRIAVLGSPQSWYLQDLVRAARGEHDLLSVTFGDLAAAVGPEGSEVNSGGIDLTSVDVVLARTMPAASLEQVVFRMDLLGRLEQEGTIVVNPARAIEAAVDKFLATAKLAAAGLPVPPTRVCQTADEAMNAFEAMDQDAVIKPLFGAEGRGITRIVDDEILHRTAKLLTSMGAIVYLQSFIPHDGYDVRVLVVGSKVLGITRHNTTDWRTNVSRGATTCPLEMTPEIADLALRAARAVGAPLAGVDLLPATSGAMYVLEVNAVPGWRALGQTLQVDVSRRVIDYLQTLVG